MAALWLWTIGLAFIIQACQRPTWKAADQAGLRGAAAGPDARVVRRLRARAGRTAVFAIALLVHLVRSRRQALGVIICGLTLLLPLAVRLHREDRSRQAVEAGGVEPESGEVTAAKVAAAGEAVAEDVEPEEAEEGAEFYRELDDGRIVRRYGQGMASDKRSEVPLAGRRRVICGLVYAPGANR